MNKMGKKIKVNSFNLEFGKQAQITNVIAFYKYKEDNGLYAICCEDSNIKYGIVNYGSAYIKENTLIIIGLKEPKQEMVQELFFKVNEGKDLTDNFELQPLDSVEFVELVSPNKVELKGEVVEKVINETIELPQEEIKEKENTKINKKKSSLPIILILLIIIGVAGYYFFILQNDNSKKIYKSIVCTKNYRDKEYNIEVSEDNKYSFSQNDILEYVDKLSVYKFTDEDEYNDFMESGSYYKYLPEENGGITPDDNNSSFSIVERVDATKADYKLPTGYEEVIKYYKKEGYTCEEKIEE